MMPKIWIIGASEGIGRALAVELANDKENFLILSARNTERLKELSDNLNSESLLIPIDVTNKESVLNGWQKIKEKSITIDRIVYCAGYYKPMSAESMEIDEIEKMICVNLTGAIRVLNLVIPEFIKQKRGDIILIGSIVGYRGLPNSLGYGSSKAGIINQYITKAMKTNCFESRFPFLFANFLKLASKLPYWLYFILAKIIKPN